MRNPKKYHKIWNENHPDDSIQKGDGFVIHHIDGNTNNNNISKMTISDINNNRSWKII